MVPDEVTGAENDASKFARGLRVAVVSLKGGPLPNLYLTDKKDNEVFLYYTAPDTWTARIDGEATRTLSVDHYHYDGLTMPTDFPVTVRWDFWRASPTAPLRLVMGVRCATAWCIIGVDPRVRAAAGRVGSDTPDPDDPYKPGHRATLSDSTPAPPPPNYRRVRGFYDKMPVGGDSFQWIYPDVYTATANDDAAFEKDRWLPQFAVRKGAKNVFPDSLERRFGVSRPKLFGWLWRRWRVFELTSFNYGEAGMDHKTLAGNMPAAARWGTSHTDYNVPDTTAGPRVQVVTGGSVWIRCASGCCSSNVAF